MLIKHKMNFSSLRSDLKNNSCHFLDFLRSDSIEKTLSIKGIYLRRLGAPFLRFLYSFQSEYKFVSDGREKLETDKKGKIFIANHRQSDDVVFIAKAVHKSAYFVFGNPVLALDSLKNGVGLWLYGMILLNRGDKGSRQAAYHKMKYILQHGGNIIICPEGYWNLADDGEGDERHGADSHNSENWLIQDINIGVIRLAKEIQCEIVPVVLHYDEVVMKCYARRCKAEKVSDDDDVFKRKDEIVQVMVDTYYCLMEKYSFYKRHDLEKGGKTLLRQWEELKEKLVADCDIDAVDYKLDLKDEKRIGKAKVTTPVVTKKEAFAFMDRLVPCRNNAFLFRRSTR